MKKLYFLLLALCFFATANSQNINFPDSNLKAKLIALGVDTNTDGEISQAEAFGVMDLNISSSNISDLTGIEYFDNVYTLICSGNNLTDIDFSGMNGLYDLIFKDNINTSVILRGLPHSTDMQFSTFTHLIINDSPRLSSLQCRYNNLEQIQINNSPNVYSIDCSHNYNLQPFALPLETLTNLDISNNSLWEYVFIKNGREAHVLTDIGNTNLRYICCDESQIAFHQARANLLGFTNLSINSYCSFEPGGVNYTMQGNSKFDVDNNGCDLLDTNLPNLKYSITNGTNSGVMIANTSGDYSIPVQAGTHTVSPVFENPSYFNVSPASFSVTFPTQASPFSQNFCVAPNGVHPDLEITLLPTTPARPGFNSNYALTYKNKGNQVHSGTVTLAFDDSLMDLVAATPAVTSQIVNALSWDYVNLQPFESRVIYLTMDINAPMDTPAVNIGDQLNFTAMIFPTIDDETPVDNTSAIKQIVVGSYDPNDKTCLEGATIAPSEVGKYVHYMIRFENTGTYPAENVVVKDMIDTNKFDVNSLVPIKGSNDYFSRINGNKVEFIFENINLPFDDANNDGYVAFKIKTKPTLTTGSSFSNSASIYFDYNLPIVTNTATTTIQALSAQDFDFGSYFAVYPNPVNNVLNIETKQAIEVSSINIYNTLGQLVLVVPNAQNVAKVDVSSLSAGNYFIKINSDKGTANTKFIKN